LLRFAGDPAVAAERVRTLYARGAAAPTPPAPTGTVAGLLDLDLARARPEVVTATNRGDIAATLVHLYRGGPTVELTDAVERYVGAATRSLAPYDGTVALVLDRSTSMRGYGDREWAVASQAQAFRLVLERICGRLVVVPVGGGPTASAAPHGPTDLATGLVAAVAAAPDVVAVVSDGYENIYPGDLARVVATLPRLPGSPPVVFCNATFGHSDDLSLRRPAPALPQRAFWHQEDLVPLVLWLLAHAGASRWLGDALRQRLAAAEHAVADTIRTVREGARHDHSGRQRP
jgi:hypothetical protein